MAMLNNPLKGQAIWPSYLWDRKKKISRRKLTLIERKGSRKKYMSLKSVYVKKRKPFDD